MSLFVEHTDKLTTVLSVIVYFSWVYFCLENFSQAHICICGTCTHAVII